MLTTLILLAQLISSPGYGENRTEDTREIMKEAWRAGRQFVESELYVKGTDYLESYTKIAPECPDAWYWLGKAYQGRGMIERAQIAFTKALAINSEYPPLSRLLQNRVIEKVTPLWDLAGSRNKKIYCTSSQTMSMGMDNFSPLGAKIIRIYPAPLIEDSRKKGEEGIPRIEIPDKYFRNTPAYIPPSPLINQDKYINE